MEEFSLRGLHPTSSSLALGLCSLLVCAGAACSEPDGCTLVLVFGIEVEVRDAVSGAFIAGPVRGVVRDGAFEDSLRVVSSAGTDPTIPTVVAGAAERPGTYVVHVESAGYRPWDTTNVAVVRNACHVRPTTLTARLEPEAQR